jgi:hypothetical protein
MKTTACINDNDNFWRIRQKEKSRGQPSVVYENILRSRPFDDAEKGPIAFLPDGATPRVIGLFSCLSGSFEVMVDKRIYNVFEVSLFARCTPICEPIRAKGRAIGA